jgi:dTDP-glucose 4,6-dehydratase
MPDARAAFAPRRLLVTGGAGFIGSAFVEASLCATAPSAAASLERLIVLDALTYAGHREHLVPFDADRRFLFVHGDIADRPLVERLFREHDFDAVVHLAAESHVDRSITDGAPFVHTNVVGTFTLLEVAHAAWHRDDSHAQAPQRPRRFLHVSSDEVYGALPPGSTARFDESSRYAPSSPYAASKASSDHFARAYFVTHGLPTIVTHSSNNFGPRQYPEKLVPLCIANAIAGAPLPIYGDGHQVREWLYVDDHAAALWRALTLGRPGETYDFGGIAELENGDVVSRIADAIDAALGRSPGTSRRLITHVPDRPGHDFRYALDSTKARHELGWQPRVSFDDGLARTVQWFLTPPAPVTPR